MTWKERLIGIPLAAIGAVLLFATAAGMALSHTEWGREEVRDFVLGELNRTFRGRFEIDAFLGGDFFRNARMAGVRIYEPGGGLFAEIDTLEVTYRWSDFLIGNVVVPKVTLVGPVVRLRRAEDSWNFQDVFAATKEGDSSASGADGGPSRRIVLRDVSIRSGDLTLYMPWQPGRGEDAESPRWRLVETEFGWERELRIQRLNATLPFARVTGPRELGRLLQIAHFTGSVRVFKDPVEVEQLRADIEQHSDTISFDIWEGTLPESRIFGGGWVTLSSKPEYDFTLTGTPINTRDLAWLIPQVPQGVVQLDYRMRSLDNGVAFEAGNAEWSSAEAEVSGHFAMRSLSGAERLAFDSVDVEIDRLASSLIAQLTGWEPPVAGDISGDLLAVGSLSNLRLEGDLVLAPEGHKPVSIKASGTVFGTREDPGAETFELSFDTLSLDLVRAFVPDLAVEGEVRGRAGFDGSLSQGIALFFELDQWERGRNPSSFRGGGMIRRGADSLTTVDVEVLADPISLTTLSAYYPLIPFRGEFRGRVGARGRLDRLTLEASLAGTGDSLLFNGLVGRRGGVTRYEGELRGFRAKVASFREGVPDSDLDFRVEFEGQGTELAQLEGRARADLSRAFVGGVRFDSAYAELRVDGERVHVDTAVIDTELGRLQAAGALGLRTEIVDSVAFEVEADSLSGLNRWISPGFDPLSAATLATNGAGGPTTADEAVLLQGSAHIWGRLVGSVRRLAVRGRFEGENVRYGDWIADSLTIERFEATAFGAAPRLRGDLDATGAGLGELRFGSVSVRGEVIDSLADFSFEVRNEGGASVAGQISAELREAVQSIQLENLTAQLGRSLWSLDQPGRLLLEESGALSLEPLALEGPEGRIAVGGSITVDGPAAFSVAVEGLELGDIASLWPDSLPVAGKLTLNAKLSGLARDPMVEAEMNVTSGELLGAPFSELSAALGYRGGEANMDLSMSGETGRLFRLYGNFPMDLTLTRFGVSVPDREMGLTFEGDSIPLSLASLITDLVQFSSGVARASIEIGGSPEKLSLSGDVDFVDGSAYVVPTGINYERVTGRAAFRGDTVDLIELRVRGRDSGSGLISGSITLENWRNPKFDLQLRASELPAYDQLDARMVISGNAELEGPYEGATLTGELSVVSGVLFIEEIGRRRKIVDPTIDPFAEEFFLLDTTFTVQERFRTSAGNVFLDSLTIDQRITVARDTWLRSEETNVEIAGELTLRLRPAEDELRIDGTLRALRGDYRLFNKRFAVREGEIEFVGTPALNPNLRIVATHRVQTQKRPLEIRVLIEGTLEEPMVTLESDAQPPIPESDLLSYLLFGRPSYEITRAGGEHGSLLEDVTAGVPEAFFGYALESLLVGETGIAYVDVSRAPVGGTENAYSSSAAPALAATQVEVGWYLAPTVFVSVAQHLSTAVNLPTVRLEWRMDNNLTLQGVAEPRLARGTTVLAQNPGADLTETVGLFLFYGWSY